MTVGCCTLYCLRSLTLTAHALMAMFSWGSNRRTDSSCLLLVRHLATERVMRLAVGGPVDVAVVAVAVLVVVEVELVELAVTVSTKKEKAALSHVETMRLHYYIHLP